MSFPIYSSYTDSGFAWLGEAPSHWSVRPLKYLVSLRSGGTPSKAREDFWDGSIPWASAKDLKGERISDTDDHISEAAISEGSIGLNAANSVLILVRGMMLARAFPVVEALVPMAINQDLKAINPKAGSVAGRFLVWSLRGTARESLDRCSEAGHGTKALRMEDWLIMPFPVPPIDEQHAIAAFLDRETTKIDALVEEQRRLIALLKEKRQAVTSHAVTKGLNPDAPTKDSGFEWLGDVPAHWRLVPVRSLFSFVKRQNGDDLEVLSVYRDYGIIRKSDRDDNNNKTPEDLSSYQTVQEGDIVVNKMKAWQGSLGVSKLIGITSPDYAVFAPKHGEDDEYLNLLLRCQLLPSVYRKISNGIRLDQWRLEPDKFKEIILPVPPLDEQHLIMRSMQTAINEIDRLEDLASNAVTLLAERRAALISAAVTGKIDVRGSAKVLPFPVDRARARRLIAAEIIDRSAHHATFGRTKLQKLLYLAEAHANVNELAGRYVRMPYGPLDQDMIDEIESAAVDMSFAVDDPGNRKMVRYRPVAARGRSRSELTEWLGDDRVAKLDKLITDFADLDTHAAEAVATLYAVWNDALIDGETPSDDWIVNGFLTAWNKTKAENFDRHELPHWLGWMRRHGLVPTGAGPKTGIGGLFV